MSQKWRFSGVLGDDSIGKARRRRPEALNPSEVEGSGLPRRV